MKKWVDESLSSYSHALAGAVPTPGGGSAAALVGALGVALLEMALGYSASSDSRLKRFRMIRKQLMALVDEDTKAYHKVVESWKKGPPQKQKALREAIKVPLAIGHQCQKASGIAKKGQKKIKRALKSDWEAGDLFLKAASRTASLNVKENLKEIKRVSKRF